ncbi:MAG: glutamine-synthetase adenylyltransferase [Acidobacteriaceae bacterium]|nr:glutamine-synthetase adenylyltransferase [Acidobacteriaceae bacterium]
MLIATAYLSRLEQLHPEACERIKRQPSSYQSALAVFAHSPFLAEEILQHPDWLEELCAGPSLHQSCHSFQFAARLEAALPPGLPDAVHLARFRRRELLRILLRDVRGLAQLPETTGELSHLADAILDVTLARVIAHYARRHGLPSASLSVLAVGKLGGEELNYSSDIDLIFLYAANGDTAGPNVITNKQFAIKVAQLTTELLSRYTPEGICYRVDLRLRPEGRLGEVAISLDAAKNYYQSRGRDWELQMLIKARVAAGDSAPGRELLAFVQPLIYSTSLDFSALEAVSQTRLRIHEQLASRKLQSGSIDVKLSPGGIRDIEFLVQCLQRLHGGREPWVRHGGTMLALSRLHDKELLSPIEYSRLTSAYQFLRHLEHRLQFEDDRQTHTLPPQPKAIARRMPPAEAGGVVSAERLLETLHLHLAEVHEIYERVIHAQQPVYHAPEPAAQPSNLVRFLDQKAPGLATLLALRPPARSALALEHFLEKMLDLPGWLGLLDCNPKLASYVLDIFETSPYLSEQLVRTPDLLAEFALFHTAPTPPPPNADPPALRRYFRREMFRLQAESICLNRPVFTTLERASQLGEWIIDAAYRIAAAPDPSPGLMVIALGRLGMGEFDLGSDADLIFALPDSAAGELARGDRIAERLIEILSAYTGEGMMFAVDSRLRPNGRAGSLVQSAAAFRDYFERHAETWEGMAFMKARAVAGDRESTTAFLNELQHIDWRRYGQSGRSRHELRRMRLRLERQHGAAQPLKAGAGGYYDIDFILMYLRLKSAGFFFKQLSTPQRIDVVEKMGHLDPASALFLRDAATFYRALDHGLRVIFGNAEPDLPKSPLHLEMLTDVIRRWTPPHLHDQPLPAKVELIRRQTRQVFDRLFAAP